MIRKPIEPEMKAKLKPGTEFLWIICTSCGCQFEVTKTRAEMSPNLRICYDCFIKELDKDKLND